MVGSDFLRVLVEFYERGIINRGFKNGFVTSVPRREGPRN